MLVYSLIFIFWSLTLQRSCMAGSSPTVMFITLRQLILNNLRVTSGIQNAWRIQLLALMWMKAGVPGKNPFLCSLINMCEKFGSGTQALLPGLTLRTARRGYKESGSTVRLAKFRDLRRECKKLGSPSRKNLTLFRYLYRIESSRLHLVKRKQKRSISFSFKHFRGR